jgi:hypothetical protein
VLDMAKRPRTAVAEIAAAIQGRGKLGHSAVYWWMWDHYDEIENGRHGRSDWLTVTAALTRIGIKNRDGSALKPENVRKTYGRVARDKERLASQTTAGTAKKRTQPALATSAVVRMLDQHDEADPNRDSRTNEAANAPAPRHQFGLAKLKRNKDE